MRFRTPLCIAMSAAMCLSGCVGAQGLSDVKPVAFLKGESGTLSEVKDSEAPSLTVANSGDASPIITDLLNRRSVLASGSAYDQVAQAVLSTSSGVAEAELRASKMRAVARSKNWLPTVGPYISLDSLGELVAGLLVEVTLYDNGKRKAERAFAAADVEVSAVALSQDMNDRVFDGLKLYITTAEAREKASMAERGLGRMREFNRVVSERVSGGASSLSDQRVVRSIISEMEHEARTHREAQQSAAAELATLTGGANLPELTQATGLSLPPESLTQLDVVRAEAEAKRAQAEGSLERASMLPTLGVTGFLGQGDNSSVDYKGGGLGLGTAAEMEASRAREAAAQAGVAKAREAAARKRAQLDNRLSALKRQEHDSADLVQQTRANYRIFQDQFEAGQKSVMDVLSVYEQMIREELKHIDLKYEIALTELEIARVSGALADGASI
ncbi:TolC family protein [Celeribacter halophilus]|uniref:TolC family protein n=1 Tax=Celeribacter halophilus TaxID=576117 RepID=UPI001C080926|nr:TolC family protein [Celeribacter halophilus]MBU2891563.1 TolC family protein [Celeribacter halophilus]MDO6509721.1 TolC family protein [Celeribacter halophilus]